MKKNGFTIFFAVLVSSLALAVGLAIYDLLQRELTLSQVATQSQYAIYAADTGAECALYWDSKAPMLNGSPSAFGTTSVSAWGTSVACNGRNVDTVGTPPNPYQDPPTGWGPWNHAQADTKSATTTFTIAFPPLSYRAEVTVAKYAPTAGDPSRTTITSRGYNTCANNGVSRLERALQVSY